MNVLQWRWLFWIYLRSRIKCRSSIRMKRRFAFSFCWQILKHVWRVARPQFCSHTSVTIWDNDNDLSVHCCPRSIQLDQIRHEVCLFLCLLYWLVVTHVRCMVRLQFHSHFCYNVVQWQWSAGALLSPLNTWNDVAGSNRTRRMFVSLCVWLKNYDACSIHGQVIISPSFDVNGKWLLWVCLRWMDGTVLFALDDQIVRLNCCVCYFVAVLVLDEVWDHTYHPCLMLKRVTLATIGVH